MRLPQFTIQRMMWIVAIAAGMLFLLRSEYKVFVVFGSIPFLIAYSAYALTRRSRVAAACCFALASVVCNVAVAACCVFERNHGGSFLMWLLSILMGPLILGFGIAWAVASTGPRTPWRRNIGYAWTVLFMGGLPLTMLVEPWPLRLAFLISRPAMDRLADRVMAGQPLQGPERAGLFRVVGTAYSAETGSLALIVDPNPGGRSAFVRLKPGYTIYDHINPLVNFNFDEHMAGRWWYQNED